MPRKQFDNMWIRSDYMEDNFDPTKFRGHVEDLVDLLLNSDVKFDAIACRGVSGLIVAAPVSFILDKPLVVVRKFLEGSHSNMMVEGYLEKNLRYIIVDDFMKTGNTIRKIIEEISYFYDSQENPDSEWGIKSARCVGVFFYTRCNQDNLNNSNACFFKKYIRGPIQYL